MFRSYTNILNKAIDTGSHTEDIQLGNLTLLVRLPKENEKMNVRAIILAIK